MNYTLKVLYDKSLERGNLYSLPIKQFLDNKYLQDLSLYAVQHREETFNDLPETIQSPDIYKYLITLSLLTDLTQEFTDQVKNLESPLKMIGIFYEAMSKDTYNVSEYLKPLMSRIIRSRNFEIEDVNRLIALQDLMDVVCAVLKVNDESFGRETLLELEKFVDSAKYVHDSPTAQKHYNESLGKLKNHMPVFVDLEEIDLTANGPTAEDALVRLKGNTVEYNEPTLTEQQEEDLTEEQIIEPEMIITEPIKTELLNGSGSETEKMLKKAKVKELDIVVPDKEFIDKLKVIEKEEVELDNNFKDYEVIPKHAYPGSEMPAEKYNELITQIINLKKELNRVRHELSEAHLNGLLIDNLKVAYSRLELEREAMIDEIQRLEKELNYSYSKIETTKSYIKPEEHEKALTRIQQLNQMTMELKAKVDQLNTYCDDMEEENERLKRDAEVSRNTSAWTHMNRAVRRVFRKLAGDGDTKE